MAHPVSAIRLHGSMVQLTPTHFRNFKSYCAMLAFYFGGKWTFHYPCHWYKDDGTMRVCRVSNGVDQFDDPLPGPGRLYLYREGHRPALLSDAIDTIIKQRGEGHGP